MYNFGIRHHEEQFCEIILASGSGDVLLKDFLSGALAAHLFSGTEPFMLFCKRASWEHSCEVILNLDQRFRRCLLKKKFMDAGQRLITIAHPEPSAQAS